MLKRPGPEGFHSDDGIVNSMTTVFLGKFGYIIIMIVKIIKRIDNTRSNAQLRVI